MSDVRYASVTCCFCSEAIGPKVEADAEVGEPSAGASTSPGGDAVRAAALLRKLNRRDMKLARMELKVAHMQFAADTASVTQLQLQLHTLCTVAQTYKADIADRIQAKANSRSKATDSVRSCDDTYERSMHALLAEMTCQLSGTSGWLPAMKKIQAKRNGQLVEWMNALQAADQRNDLPSAAKKARQEPDSSSDSD